MILISHIFIALFSVAYTTYLLVSPTQNKLKLSYGLVVATLISGTYLVVSSDASILRSCATGLAYTTIVSLGIAIARKKLARATVESNIRSSKIYSDE